MSICVLEAPGSKLRQKKRIFIFSGLLLIGFVLEFLFLEADLPAFGLTYFQPMDEGLYSKVALNLYKYGAVNGSQAFPQYIAPTYRTSILMNGLQFLFMKMFGNHYFAFRLPYLLVGYASILLLFFNFSKLIERNVLERKARRWLLLLFLPLTFFDFNFFIARRVVENSLVRAFFVLLLVTLALQIKSARLKFFLLAFVACASIVFVYFSNVFILFYILAYFILVLKKKYAFKDLFFYSLLGALAVLILAELYYFLVWGQGLIQNFLGSIGDYSTRIASSSGGGMKLYLKNFLALVGSNIFSYNVLFLVLALLAVFHAIKKSAKGHELSLLGAVLLLGFTLQASLTRDYYERKTFCIYFLLLLLVFDFVADRLNAAPKLSRRSAVLLFFSYLFMVVANLYVKTGNGYYLDFSASDKAFLAFSILAAYFLLMAQLGARLPFKRLLAGLLGVSLVTNAYFIVRHGLDTAQTEKRVMLELKAFDGEYILGPFSHSFSLYNETLPLVNTYQKLNEYAETEAVQYALAYGEDRYLDFNRQELFENTAIHYRLKRRLKRYFRTFGIEKNAFVFEKRSALNEDKRIDPDLQ